MNKESQGFTLIELLVVIAIISLLMSVVLPSLRMAKRKAAAVVCMVHLKNMSLGWYGYAQDNSSEIMSSYMQDCDLQTACTEGWIGTPFDATGTQCNATASDPVVTDEDEIRGIRQGKLYEYLKDEKVYNCPGDDRKAPDGSNMYVSYSIARCLYGWTNRQSAMYNKQIKKFSDLKNPSMRYNFVECGESNLNWGGGGDFRIASIAEGAPDFGWWTPVAVCHGNSSNFGFADGHAETRKWHSDVALEQYHKATRMAPGATYGIVYEDPKSEDLQWIISGWAYGR